MTFVTFWNSLPGWVKGVVIVVIIAVLYFIAWKPLKLFIEKEQAKKKQKDLEGSVIQLSNGGTLSSGAVASEIWTAFYDNDWLGATEDEARAVNAINGVPEQYIPLVEQSYLTLYNKVLREDMMKFISASEWNQIKHLFN